MQNKRQIGFVIAILVGLFAGLVLGWLLNPMAPRNATLDALRGDYQADYVLMVAEKFATDQDKLTAESLLQRVSPSDPALAIRQALILGQQLGYSERELQLINLLENALSIPPVESAVPSSAEQVTP